MENRADLRIGYYEKFYTEVYLYGLLFKRPTHRPQHEGQRRAVHYRCRNRAGMARVR